MEEWVSATSAQGQQIHSPAGVAEAVLHEPLPFSGDLFDKCVKFDSVVLRPPGGAHPIDLLADPAEFKQGDLGGTVVEAEYEEINKK